MLEETARVLKALGEPTRLKIFRLLQERELCVCELVALTDMSQPRVSQHLKILRQAGIIQERKDGQRSFFRPQGGYVEGRIVSFEQLTTTGIEDMPDFKDEVRRLGTLDSDEQVQACKEAEVIVISRKDTAANKLG